MNQLSFWGENAYQSRDRWSHPCSTCSGTGTVLKHERMPCGCIYQCPGCDGKSLQPVTKECHACNGNGIAT